MTLEGADIVSETLDAPPAEPQRGRRLSPEAEVLGAGLLILSGAFVYPYLEKIAEAIMPGCLFKHATGLPCLLCGMTRSLAATAHGRIGEAFRMHLLGPPLLLLVLAVTVSLTAEYALSRQVLPRPGKRAWRYITWGTLGLLAAAWVARLIFFGVNI